MSKFLIYGWFSAVRRSRFTRPYRDDISPYPIHQHPHWMTNVIVVALSFLLIIFLRRFVTRVSFGFPSSPSSTLRFRSKENGKILCCYNKKKKNTLVQKKSDYIFLNGFIASCSLSPRIGFAFAVEWRFYLYKAGTFKQRPTRDWVEHKSNSTSRHVKRDYLVRRRHTTPVYV